MEAAIQAADPLRWEKYLARRGEAPVDVESDQAESGGQGAPAAIEESERVEDDGWDELWASDEERDPGPGEPRTDTALGSGSGEPEASELVNRICSVDVCEVFSPPRVGTEGKYTGSVLGTPWT